MLELKKREDQFLNEAVYFGTHESGVKVYIMPKAGYNKKYAIFMTKYGSVDTEFETEGEKIKIPDGTAHFLEHKMFDMPDGSDAFLNFSKYGANANAFTSFSVTAYHFSSTDNFKENLKNLVEFVETPCFTQKSVDKEQGIIGQEIKMYLDDPNWRVFFNCLDSMYHNNTVKLDIAGSVESISTIDEKVLNDIYSYFYHPENMVLFISGDVEPSEMADYLDTIFKKCDKGSEIKRNYPEEPEGVLRKFVSQRLSVSVPLFAIGFKDNEKCESGKEFLAREIKTEILLNMLFSKVSPIYKKLYESSLINESFNSDFSYSDTYSFVLLEGESNEPKKVYDSIMEEIKGFKLTEELYECAKNMLWGKFVRMFNSTDKVGYNFSIGYLNNIDYFDYKDIFNEVTFFDVEERFKKLFTEEMCVLSIIEGDN